MKKQKKIVCFKGFTFIEILIVITIIALLGSIIGISYVSYLKKAKKITAETQIKNLSIALESFYIDNGYYPATEEGLLLLVNKTSASKEVTNWNGPYIDSQKIPADPWGNPYVYVFPGLKNPSKYDLFTLGRDKKEGGESEDQDIGNWQ